jgi:hypothetical protein
MILALYSFIAGIHLGEIDMNDVISMIPIDTSKTSHNLVSMKSNRLVPMVELSIIEFNKEIIPAFAILY